jgi:hypothetical protein
MLLFFLTFSGIIDFFAVYNREPGGLRDVKANPVALWIANNTPPDAIFLNSIWFYHPANLSGRYIFSGYPYFTWSYGYDKDKRESLVRQINSGDKFSACRLLNANHISYVELTDRYDEYFTANRKLWESEFVRVFRDENDNISIYNVNESCNQQ